MSDLISNKGITKERLQELMEELDPGCTTVKNKYTYTDVSNFQITMGNALARVPAPYEQYGYSYLADTTDAYFTWSNTTPPDMPVMPNKPDYNDKV